VVSVEKWKKRKEILVRKERDRGNVQPPIFGRATPTQKVVSQEKGRRERERKREREGEGEGEGEKMQQKPVMQLSFAVVLYNNVGHCLSYRDNAEESAEDKDHAIV